MPLEEILPDLIPSIMLPLPPSGFPRKKRGISSPESRAELRLNSRATMFLPVGITESQVPLLLKHTGSDSKLSLSFQARPPAKPCQNGPHPITSGIGQQPRSRAGQPDLRGTCETQAEASSGRTVCERQQLLGNQDT